MANNDIYPYGQGATMPAGYPIADNLVTNSAQQSLSARQGVVLKAAIDALGDGGGSQWSGKKWYGFGTSMTNTTNEGKYPTYLAQISGMNFVNKGQSGGGITTGSNQAVYNAVMNTDLTDADLVTLECGVNDAAASIGTIYDGLNGETIQDNSTFCGALNLCLQHLLSTTTAQIVVIFSPMARYAVGNSTDKRYGNETFASDSHTFLDVFEATRKVCALNSVYFIYGGYADGMGYARMNASDDYNVDQIHHTNLGGYNFAQAIWSQLKNIPLFYTAIPT